MSKVLKRENNKVESYWGLPNKVIFCKRCVMSNQRPCSYPEFKHTSDRKTPTLHIDEEGICDACRYAEKKEQIDWSAREKELLKMLDGYRSKDGSFDCILPGSGGKDSIKAAHLIKYKYGMHPLTVTWPPFMYTEYGWKNFNNWLEVGGFGNVSVRPNPKVHALLTRLSVENLLHPFQTFILGQKNMPIKLALQMKIPLIIYGENEAEYGNPAGDNETSLRDASYHTYKHLNDLHIAGLSIRELKERYELTMADLSPYLPSSSQEFADNKVDVRYLGYYAKWTPQESYYYAVEHAGFQARPHRSEGTYSKYNSIDDKIDDLHYHTTYTKFGIGRATYDASQEIRNRHLTREEGVALVRRFDGEDPKRYLKDVLGRIGITQDNYRRYCDNSRSPHLWKREGGQWKLRHPVWESE
ncbi:N-acetyl sugar amidotransferase [Elusimicrobiota bacterium]